MPAGLLLGRNIKSSHNIATQGGAMPNPPCEITIAAKRNLAAMVTIATV